MGLIVLSVTASVFNIYEEYIIKSYKNCWIVYFKKHHKSVSSLRYPNNEPVVVFYFATANILYFTTFLCCI